MYSIFSRINISTYLYLIVSVFCIHVHTFQSHVKLICGTHKFNYSHYFENRIYFASLFYKNNKFLLNLFGEIKYSIHYTLSIYRIRQVAQSSHIKFINLIVPIILIIYFISLSVKQSDMLIGDVYSQIHSNSRKFWWICAALITDPLSLDL